MPDIDYSRQQVPQSWTEAAREAPGAGISYQSADGHRGPRVRAVPGPGADTFTAFFATAAVSMAGGVAWYQAYIRGATYPWVALIMALAIALALRLAIGPRDGQTRSMMGLLFYLVSASLVVFLIVSHNYADLYGARPSWGQFEDELLRSRLTDPLFLAAWAGGALLTVSAPRFLR
ncbi:MAG: hypothetical protein AAF962_07670 [Actinomycetota bacterium]